MLLLSERDAARTPATKTVGEVCNAMVSFIRPTQITGQLRELNLRLPARDSTGAEMSSNEMKRREILYIKSRTRKMRAVRQRGIKM